MSIPRFFLFHRSLVFLACVLGLGSASVPGADWPQYRGPNHDGKSPESVAAWPAAGPKVAWKNPTPTGFSSFTNSGGKAFTLVRREVDGAEREVCLSLDAASGKELWAAPVGIAKYQGGGDDGKAPNRGGDGPRSTPQLSYSVRHFKATCGVVITASHNPRTTTDSRPTRA